MYAEMLGRAEACVTVLYLECYIFGFVLENNTSCDVRKRNKEGKKERESREFRVGGI